ncbi:hypothetical protein ASE90_16710 [Sphingomonas sp. Leaf67]|nr:hypothetical protein ASE90_16710 [Sphingomonas sp. Leaf67]
MIPASPAPGQNASREATVAPATFPMVRKVDPRFQSYNVEMVEVVGGRFWAPYAKPGDKPATADRSTSGGVDIAAMFSKRPPLDLANDRRLRTLARELGPAYMRVSGAWANRVFFHDADTPAPAGPPAGFESMLTRPQWAGVIDFAKFVDASIVGSFPVGIGARNPDGSWDPDQARRMIRYTRDRGGEIVAAELVNEPNVGPQVGVPKDYTAARFAQDIAAFRRLVETDAPQMRTVGPGSTGEGGFVIFPARGGMIPTPALMSAEPRPTFDAFSYHFYGTVSSRCAAMDKTAGIAPEDALSEAWLARADQVFDAYKAYRDHFLPGAPIWVTEMGQAGCGGDRWAATWLDSFRYVDQMARLAKRGVDVIFHNTLSASDYALIDDVTELPRPSYWAALLWRRLMGETVLDAGEQRGRLHLYAHCLRGSSGGVAVVAINLNDHAAATVVLTAPAQRYTLTADELQASTVKLNGKPLRLGSNDAMPTLRPEAQARGSVRLPAASISFLAMPGASNLSCR